MTEAAAVLVKTEMEAVKIRGRVSAKNIKKIVHLDEEMGNMEAPPRGVVWATDYLANNTANVLQARQSEPGSPMRVISK